MTHVLYVNISLRNSSDALTVADSVELPELNFGQMAELLVQFQAITEEFKARIATLRTETVASDTM